MWGHLHADLLPDVCVAARSQGRNLGVAASEQFTEGQVWIVPRVFVDNTPGWVHTGLNPSIPAVQAGIAAANEALKAAATAGVATVSPTGK